MSMFLETGVTGAKKTSWEHNNPRDLLLSLTRKHPKADEESLARYMRDELLDKAEECLLPVIRYFVCNNLRSLKSREYKARPPAEARQEVEQAKKQIEAVIDACVEQRLLDLILPTGKSLAESTGADCRHAGGWFAAIADKVAPHEKVGDVLDEKGLRDLFAATAARRAKRKGQ